MTEATLYLCRPGGTMLGTLSGLDELSVSLTEQVSSPWELTFDVLRYVEENGNLVETSYYSSIAEKMELYLQYNSEEKNDVRFIIDSSPSTENNGINEIKTVTAHSIEAELQGKMLRQFYVNTGQKASAENLVKGDIFQRVTNSQTDSLYKYNTNPYTELPVDYIKVWRNTSDDSFPVVTQKSSGSVHFLWRDYNADLNIADDGMVTSSDCDIVRLFKDTIKEYPRLQQTIVYGTSKVTDTKIHIKSAQITVYFDDSTSKEETYSAKDGMIKIDYDADAFVSARVTAVWDDESVTTYKYIHPSIVLTTKPKNEYLENDGMCIVECYLNIADNKAYVTPSPYKYQNTNNTVEIYSSDETHNTEYYTKRFVDAFSTIKTFYQTFGSQLSLLDLAIEKAHAAGWSVGDVPSDVANTYQTFSVDSQDIYSFLNQTCTKSMKVVFDFDRINKKINVIDVSNNDAEYDSGVFIGLRNLANKISVKTASDDGIKTKFKVTGGNSLGINYVNFGQDYIINLDYFMSKVDEYGDYQYVSPELKRKYELWKNYCNQNEINISYPSWEYDFYDKTYVQKSAVDATLNRRAAYTQLTKAYNKSIKDINELTHLVPGDAIQTNYFSYPYEDLKKAYTAFVNALDAVIVAYKTDYKVAEFSYDDLSDIQHSMYWYDFAGYYFTIIPAIKEALKRYCETVDNADGTSSLVVDSNGDFIYLPEGNLKYNKDVDYAKKINPYEYDMSLYGYTELKNKIEAWKEAANVAYKDYFVKSGTALSDLGKDGDKSQYVVYNENLDYESLTQDQKKEFASSDDFNTQLQQYLDYVTWNPKHHNKTIAEATYGKDTKKVIPSKGVIELAQDQLMIVAATIDEIKKHQREIESKRSEIASSVTWENWHEDVNGEEVFFTEDEIAVLYTLLDEADYNNANILSTKLDDVVTTVDDQEKLYQDAQKKLVEKSQPQYSFEIDSDNLFAIPEFEPLRNDIRCLNFIYLVIGLYSNETVKLRIVSIKRNPMIPSESLELKFSNMLYTYDGISDLSYLFEKMAGGSGSSSSSSGGSSGGTIGVNDAEITLSNNLLNALLKSRLIDSMSANVSATISPTPKTNYDEIEKEYPSKKALEKDSKDVSIDGANIRTGSIKSKVVNGNNPVSFINLDDGNIGFGYDENLKDYSLSWDGQSLSIKGDVRVSGYAKESDVTDLSDGLKNGETEISGNCIKTGKIELAADSNGNPSSYIDLEKGEMKLGDYMTVDKNHAMFSGELVAACGTFSGIRSNSSFEYYDDMQPVGGIPHIDYMCFAWKYIGRNNTMSSGYTVYWFFGKTEIHDITIGNKKYYTYTMYVPEDQIPRQMGGLVVVDDPKQNEPEKISLVRIQGELDGVTKFDPSHMNEYLYQIWKKAKPFSS